MNQFDKLKSILIKLKKIKLKFHDTFMPEINIGCLYFSNIV